MSTQDRLQRSASVIFGLIVVGIVGWITADQFGKSNTRAAPTGPDAAAATVSSASVTDVTEMSEASDAASARGEPTADAGPDAASSDGNGDAGIEEAANLTGTASLPKSVRLGVVLVQFVGAEGAANPARSKKDALALATRLLDVAKTDFKQALREGDSGSSEDIGRIPRGVLDPATEGAVFRLTSGQVSEILETPRGYWIVKRVD